MSLVLWVLCASWVSYSVSSEPLFDLENAELHFERFIQEHSRMYADEYEKQARFLIFKDNLEQANRLNEKHDLAEFGITKFMDLTIEEFLKSHTGLNVGVSDYTADCSYLTDADIPDSGAPEAFDWRQLNAVTPAKDQSQCGSCYAFSSIGNIESQYAIKYKQQLDLSEQQVIDCDKRNWACGGGFMSSVFRSLVEAGGPENEADYPYMKQSGECQFDANKVRVKVADCHSLNLTSQEKVKQYLHQNGPISIAVQAEGIQYYTGGIIDDAACNVGAINHAVLLVGYGNENGVPYWIVKNSWGATWCEGGYFRMIRGESAHSCGMMNDLMATSVIA